MKFDDLKLNFKINIAFYKISKITLRRLPNVGSFEHADLARFNFFTRKLWDSIYENSANGGYTVLFVPNYFDFVRLRTFIKSRNA